MNEDIKKIKESIMKQITELEKRTNIEVVKVYTESIAAMSAALAAFATVEHVEKNFQTETLINELCKRKEEVSTTIIKPNETVNISNNGSISLIALITKEV